MSADLRFLVDDSSGVFSLRAGAIMVCRDHDRARLLMVTAESFDFAYSVGGSVIFGETTRDTLAREIKEETGAELEIGELAAIEQALYHDDEQEQDWHVVAFHYWVEVPQDFDPVTASVTINGDPERLCWIGEEEIAAGVRFFPRFYADALQGAWEGVRHISNISQDPPRGRMPKGSTPL